MAKKKASAYMTSGEKLAGTIFFVIYLVVLPFAMTPLFDLLEKLLDADISDSLRNALCYYGCFAAAVLIFRKFIANTSRRFMDNLSVCCQTVLVGLVAMYGLKQPSGQTMVLEYLPSPPRFSRSPPLRTASISG